LLDDLSDINQNISKPTDKNKGNKFDDFDDESSDNDDWNFQGKKKSSDNIHNANDDLMKTDKSNLLG
jgi:hypothetical protein